ncbi:hypothetical protein F5B22DRAFT_405718 [Xylaria bambusicola]|uniref:uncharacterized protein n=1 Tax=Xylaria bambusicola TaxID=326684 RepID=UPI00200809F1|nr:uncharacterized protein F5B22DRAFT_405718 [Xylaria bambusicola]KAI0508424.1 hypothetical protein F5B22DRAFT_405718 [Xylaria bambusicola]
MAAKVAVYAKPPEVLVKVLEHSHPLVSLPLVRRLRFAAGFPGGISEHARILWCSPLTLEEYLSTCSAHDDGVEAEPRIDENAGKDHRELRVNGKAPPFAAAYLDFSRGPETELWIYSSMEGRLSGISSTQDEMGIRAKERWGTSHEEGDDEELGREREDIASAVALLHEVKRQQDLYFAPGTTRANEREYPTVLVGNLNEILRKRLAAPDVGMDLVSTGLYDKWIFEIAKLPDADLTDDIGTVNGHRWVWDVVRREDIAFTISRTNIPRRERTMKLLPSTALYTNNGTPVAWAFLGPDSSLSSLHCEEPYRGRGIAKAVAVKLLRDHLGDYNDDAYIGWADVAPDNVQSQGVCRSLNGKPLWQISWSRLDLNRSFPEG